MPCLNRMKDVEFEKYYSNSIVQIEQGQLTITQVLRGYYYIFWQ